MLRRNVASENDEVKILRATSLLLLYNAVEATITRVILDYHKYLSSKTFVELSEKLKSHYIDLKLSECTPRTSSYETYINKSKEVVENIVHENTIEFNIAQLEGRLPLSGNIDCEYIARLFKDNWGIYVANATVPSCITEIKKKRNELAHGRMSFIEVGQNLTVEGPDGLVEYKDRTMACLRALLELMDNHVSGV